MEHFWALLIIVYLINAQPILISRTSTRGRKAKPFNAFHKSLLTEYATGTSIVQIRQIRRNGDANALLRSVLEGQSIGRFNTFAWSLVHDNRGVNFSSGKPFFTPEIYFVRKLVSNNMYKY